MDPDGKWTSTRAVLLAAAGQNCWPPAGNYMAATGQDLMAADTPESEDTCPAVIPSWHRVWEDFVRTLSPGADPTGR